MRAGGSTFAIIAALLLLAGSALALPIGFDPPASGSSGSSPVFTNTLTLPAGSSAFCTNYGDIAGVFVLGIPTGSNGVAGTNTATVFTNSVLSSDQQLLYSSNSLYFTGSNYLGSYSNLESFSIWTYTVGSSGMNTGSNMWENIWVSTNSGAAWFIVTNTPCLISNACLVSISGDAYPDTYPGSVQIYGIDHMELYGRTNSMFGQYMQFSTPSAPADAVTLSYLKSYPVDRLASSVMLNDGFQLATSLQGNTNHLTFFGYGNTLLDITLTNSLINFTSVTLSNNLTQVILLCAASNWPANAVLETATNMSSPAFWYATTPAAATNSGVLRLVANLDTNSLAQFFRGRIPAVGFINFGSNAITANLANTVIGSQSNIIAAAVTNLVAGTNITVSSSGGSWTVNSSGGSAGISNLYAGAGISLASTNGNFLINSTASAGISNAFAAPLTYSATTNVVLTNVANTAGMNYYLVLTNAANFGTPVGLSAGQSFLVNLYQDGTGTRAVTFTNTWKFPSGQALTITTNAGAWSVLSCIANATNANFTAVVQTLNFQ